MHIPIRIETERSLICPFVSQGFAAFWSFMGDPQARRFMAFTDEQKTYEGAKALLEMVITAYTSDAPLCDLAITERRRGAYVGLRGMSLIAEQSEMGATVELV